MDGTEKTTSLHHMIVEGLIPFGSALAQDSIWPIAVLPPESNEQLFALLDAARQPFLVDFLEGSNSPHRCLFAGDRKTELADVAPWLVALDPSDPFTQNLFTQSDASFHLWDNAPGIFIRSDASFDQLWHWCRKLLWVRDDSGKRFFLRWWDPSCLEITMPILKGLDAQLRGRDFTVSVLAPKAWTVSS